MANDRSILIVGGGIGGLACALALARAGFDTHVVEQAPEFGEVGAGIQMGPNMIRALGELGLRERVLGDAWAPSWLVMRDALDGSEVSRINVGEGFRDYFGDPYVVTHRADLHAAILEGCEQHERVRLETNQRVVEIADHGDHVVLHCADGATREGDFVVGADGLWSLARKHVIGDGAPVVSGHIAYRAVLRRDEVPDDLWQPDVVLWAGPKTHFVQYPLRRGELFNLVAVFHSDRYEEGWDQVGDKDELFRRFAGQQRSVLDLLERIETWKFWVLCDRPPQHPWSKGRVVLLGDAAHPTLQYLAQGAAMAVEDSLSLAEELARDPEQPLGAFRRYEDARVVRTARVQLTSRFYGDVYHATDVVREVRAAMLAPRSDEAAWNGMTWLYGAPVAAPAG